MKLGAEPKKVAILGGLTLLAAYSFYTNVLSEPDIPQQVTRPAPAQPAAGPAQPAPNVAPGRTVQRRGIYGRQAVGEFRPTLKYNRPEDRPDPMKVDPTLRLDLLAKLQTVKVEGGARSLFDFTTAPPPPAPKTPDPKIIPGSKKGAAVAAAGQPPAEVKPAEPVKPPPPPIPFKFYGFSDRKGGIKRAFFLEGEDIFVAAEGDMIKRRYKVVKIGLNSVEVEDTQHQHKQTLPLEPAPAVG
jgi:hypothetical protein